MPIPRHVIVTFLWPWLLGLIIWTGLPLVASLVFSFSAVSVEPGIYRSNWIGVAHYREALGLLDNQNTLISATNTVNAQDLHNHNLPLYTSLVNTLAYTIFAVPLGLMSALCVALLLNQRLRGMGIMRTLVYLPHVLGGAATIVIWSWLLNPQYGWVNAGLRCAYRVLDPLVRMFQDQGTDGWAMPHWLFSPFWCKPSLVMMHVWTMGPSLLVFLAALQRVPCHERDASLLDGARAWSRFRYITWPHLTPAMLFNLIITTVFAMQSFTEPYLLQHPQQQDGLLFYMLHLYQVAFEPPYRLGYACALGWIFFAVMVVLITPLLLASRRWVYEAGSNVI